MSQLDQAYQTTQKVQGALHFGETRTDLIGTGEAARLLRVSRNTIRRWVTLGILKGNRFNEDGGHFRFSRRYIEQKAASLRLD